MARKNSYADMPKIITIHGIVDGGPDGGANCPHCGAIGRWIIEFTTVDGERRGAMRGCFAKWPMSDLAYRMADIVEKEINARLKGRKIASWDQDVKAAIEMLAEGRTSEQDVWDTVRRADMAKKAYMSRMGYR